MEFIPYRVLRNEPTAMRQKLEDKGKLVVTVNDKPFAVMGNLTRSEDMDDILLPVSRLRA